MSEILKYNKLEKLKELIESMKGKTILTTKDLVLIILYAQNKPIYGRTLLFKEIFLLYMEVLKDYNDFEIQNPNFIPHHYGPYSFDIAEILNQLEWFGYIQRIGRKNSTSEKFELTDKGKNEIKETFEKLPDKLKKEIKRKRKGWDQLGTDGILRYVYQNYEKYKEKSKIKNKYKDIIWGCGRA
ncbi:hypothetical protein [Methanothermococcus okinawensis]|uniref:Antitoxin SocA-like Panacea domain-containing protein n=1 Tax=Methanothermococcus okinawensis (strain DSM 14208 / JCM 11175 / IH1) TaxID=647113 RepID=F8ANT5_METOI|nr:hypothetical protein [Methanothermococcus okinawensis]AEH06287.1 hypothetical protein Metok_0297 [Methanothermococcus okinawensis IH1]